MSDDLEAGTRPAAAIAGVAADGAFRRLDPAFLPASHLEATLSALGVAALAGAALAISWWLGASGPVLAGLSAAAAATVIATDRGERWYAARQLASTDYALGPDGIVIRRGVLWRSVAHVPRSRIQHTDVTQGPIERRFALGTLVLYTAGTRHARIELAGLAHREASAIRDDLLDTARDDGV